jgi:hypothetical protein
VIEPGKKYVFKNQWTGLDPRNGQVVEAIHQTTIGEFWRVKFEHDAMLGVAVPSELTAID